jgi:subtilisin family serine protease
MSGDVTKESVWRTDALVAADLLELMASTAGSPQVVVGIVDGPASVDDSIVASRVRSATGWTCDRQASPACRHGTAVTSILAGRRGSENLAIAPECSYVYRPLFSEGGSHGAEASIDALGHAIADCVEAGAHLINLSVGYSALSMQSAESLESALRHAFARGVVIVASSGNQGGVGGSPLTAHPSVLTVAACDRVGSPLPSSNLSSTLGRRGLMAPGERIPVPDGQGGRTLFSGTSAACAIVTGSLALLLSRFAGAAARLAVHALLDSAEGSAGSIVPRRLRASRAAEHLADLAFR